MAGLSFMDSILASLATYLVPLVDTGASLGDKLRADSSTVQDLVCGGFTFPLVIQDILAKKTGLPSITVPA